MIDVEKYADLWIEHGNSWDIHLEQCLTCSTWVFADTSEDMSISSLKCVDGRKIQMILAEIRMKCSFPSYFTEEEVMSE